MTPRSYWDDCDGLWVCCEHNSHIRLVWTPETGWLTKPGPLVAITPWRVAALRLVGVA
jgi:hypothetical protein